MLGSGNVCTNLVISSTTVNLTSISHICSLSGEGLPISLLPKVVHAPARAGTLQSDWHGISKGTPVGVAMGDLQCSILAAQPSTCDAGKDYRT